MDFRIPKILSFSDALQLEQFKGGGASNLPITELLEVAYSVGIDSTKGHEIKNGLHRNLSNKVVDCAYLVAEERTDPDWLASGYASIEVTIYSSDDRSLVETLRRSSGSGYSMHDDFSKRLTK